MDQTSGCNCVENSQHQVNKDIDYLVVPAIEVALAHGVIKRSSKQDKARNPINVDHARFTLWPLRIPKTHYNILIQTQTDFNLLLDKMSQNKSFLLDSLQQ